jgi:lysyl-tRNA synthetase class I
MNVEVYRGAAGLRELAGRLRGDETVHVGIRPFGLHAGNVLGIVAYPHLLCRALRDLGKSPQVRLIVSINDWEQDAPSGPDPVRYPYNIVPRGSTFQFSRTASDCAIVDLWEPRIKEAYIPIMREFTGVQVEFRRTSVLRSDPRTGWFLARTLNLQARIGGCLNELSAFEVLLDGPLLFASAVCPECFAARGKTAFLDDDTVVDFACVSCGYANIRPFQTFDWWWHHKPMFLARWYLWGIDVSLSGGDHLVDGDAAIRDALRTVFDLEDRRLLMLFAPMLVDDAGVKVSKSARNEITIPYNQILSGAAGIEDVRVPVERLLGISEPASSSRDY